MPAVPVADPRRCFCTAAIFCAALAARPFRAAAQDSARQWRAAGLLPDSGAALDNAMRGFMQRYGVRAGQLAVGRGGRILVERGYAWADPGFGAIRPQTLLRIASLSKAFTAAVVYELLRGGRLKPETRAFPLLGIARVQRPGSRFDPRIDDITVAQLLDHRGGWDIGKTGRDPTFDMRGVARALGLHVPPSKQDFARYICGEPLQFSPGAEERYSNTGYAILGLVIEKVLGLDYLAAVRGRVSQAQQFGPVFLARTRSQDRLTGEAVYDQPGTSPSQLEIDREVPAPLAYGGELIYENVDSSGGLVTTASTIVRMIARYAVWSLGGRAPGYARSGSMGGTSSWAASRPDGLDFCFIFNTRDFGGAQDPIGGLAKNLNQILDRTRVG
jgi:CubicO group peptidase (beta-lactamase class C family)